MYVACTRVLSDNNQAAQEKGHSDAYQDANPGCLQHCSLTCTITSTTQ
jgi:hypothetical protein